jgi:hypothetical protein
VVVRATSTGSQSTIAGIARMVSDAQAREAPIQRLADSVSGVFCYGVMAASLVTFAFWTLAGGSWDSAKRREGQEEEPLCKRCRNEWKLKKPGKNRGRLRQHIELSTL